MLAHNLLLHYLIEETVKPMVPVLGRHALAPQVECDDEAEFEEATEKDQFSWFEHGGTWGYTPNWQFQSGRSW